MRKKGLIFLLIVIAVVGGFLFLFADKLVEWGMEKAGSAVVGARVEFSGVDLRVFSVSMSWDRLQVTNPQNTWRNLFETGYVELNLALEPLLLKRFVIQNMQTDSLQFNTERKTDGALPGNTTTDPGTVGRVQTLIYEELETLPGYQIANLEEINVDSIIRILSLQTPSVVDSLETATDSMRNYWNKQTDNLPSRQEIVALRRKLESIQAGEADTPEEIKEGLSTVREVGNQIDSLQKGVTESRRQFQMDVEDVQDYDKTVSGSISDDVERAKKLADIPEVSPTEVTRALFGPQIANYLLTALNIIGTARYYESMLQKEEPEKRKDPPRLAGQTIRYTGVREWPKLWIQRMSVSAVIAGIFGKGSMENVSSFQELIGLPMRVGISGTDENGGSLELSGVFDYLGDIPKDSIALSVAGIRIQGSDITRSDLFPFVIDEGTGNVSGALAFVGERFLSEGRFTGNNISFVEENTPGENDNNKQLRSVRQDIINSVSSFSVEVFSEFVEDRFTLNLDSDIGRLVANAIQKMLGKEINAVTDMIRKRISRQVKTAEKELQGSVTELQSIQQAFTEKSDQLQEIEKTVRRKIAALKKEAGGGILEKIQF